MINAVQPVQQNNNSVKTSIFYMNDFHAKLPNLERVYTASQMFDTFETSADKLKLSSGDDGLGEDPVLSRAVSKMLGMIGITKRQKSQKMQNIRSWVQLIFMQKIQARLKILWCAPQ